jgi:hypothetical protein
VGGPGGAGHAVAKRSLAMPLAAAPMVAAEPAQAAPPPPAPKAESHARAVDADEREEAARDRTREHRPAVVRAVVVTTAATDLTAPEALRAMIEAHLRTMTWPATTPAGPVVLRLHVDASGKVAAVDVVSGDAGAAAALRASLVGLTSGAKATTARATLVLTIRLGA